MAEGCSPVLDAVASCRAQSRHTCPRHLRSLNHFPPNVGSPSHTAKATSWRPPSAQCGRAVAALTGQDPAHLQPRGLPLPHPTQSFLPLDTPSPFVETLTPTPHGARSHNCRVHQCWGHPEVSQTLFRDRGTLKVKGWVVRTASQALRPGLGNSIGFAVTSVSPRTPRGSRLLGPIGVTFQNKGHLQKKAASTFPPDCS